MKNKKLYNVLVIFIASVWLANGLICKVLHLVPRHQEIVETVLNLSNGRVLTLLIGLSEVVMAVWILTRIRSKVNAVVQIVVIALMNLLEILLAPEFLLWGKANSLFALLFISLIFFTEFILNPHPNIAKNDAIS